jgi:hypothetical protein
MSIGPDLPGVANAARVPWVGLRVIGNYQRLIVNPFLAVLAWGLILVAGLKLFAIRRAFPAIPPKGWPLIALVGMLIVFGPSRLCQYHCLDCGETGWLFRHRWHACATVLERMRERTFSAQFLGLGVKNQLVAWFYFNSAAAVIFLIWYVTGPGSRGAW